MYRFDDTVVYLYHCAVMLDRLPQYIDPLLLADKRGSIKGQITIKNFDRLADILHDDAGTVAVDLFFGRAGRLAFCEGDIQAVLALKCQNCLGSVPWPISSSVKLGIIGSIDQADKLPEDYEPLLINEEGHVLLKDLIEDELLLLLPSFPKHEQCCFLSNTDSSKPDDLTDNSPLSTNPFSILANFKKSGDS